MSDIREFMGHAPTHCTICGSRWGDGCKASCINSPYLNDCQDCGGEALERTAARGAWVSCSGCCRSTEMFNTFAQAIEAWNLANPA